MCQLFASQSAQETDKNQTMHGRGALVNHSCTLSLSNYKILQIILKNRKHHVARAAGRVVRLCSSRGSALRPIKTLLSPAYDLVESEQSRRCSSFARGRLRFREGDLSVLRAKAHFVAAPTVVVDTLIGYMHNFFLNRVIFCRTAYQNLLLFTQYKASSSDEGFMVESKLLPHYWYSQRLLPAFSSSYATYSLVTSVEGQRFQHYSFLTKGQGLKIGLALKRH